MSEPARASSASDGSGLTSEIHTSSYASSIASSNVSSTGGTQGSVVAAGGTPTAPPSGEPVQPLSAFEYDRAARIETYRRGVAAASSRSVTALGPQSQRNNIIYQVLTSN